MSRTVALLAAGAFALVTAAPVFAQTGTTTPGSTPATKAEEKMDKDATKTEKKADKAEKKAAKKAAKAEKKAAKEEAKAEKDAAKSGAGTTEKK
jgi:colicin import membrane protein